MTIFGKCDRILRELITVGTLGVCMFVWEAHDYQTEGITVLVGKRVYLNGIGTFFVAVFLRDCYCCS